jgi:hypothetical protein
MVVLGVALKRDCEEELRRRPYHHPRRRHHRNLSPTPTLMLVSHWNET